MATSGKLKASTLARREQAAIMMWVALPAAMSSRISCTPSAEHSMGCSLQAAILPSRVAIWESCLASRRSPMPQPVHR